MKSKSHFFHDLDLTSILEPADPNDQNYSATKVRPAARHTRVSTCSLRCLQHLINSTPNFHLHQLTCNVRLLSRHCILQSKRVVFRVCVGQHLSTLFCCRSWEPSVQHVSQWMCRWRCCRQA